MKASRRGRSIELGIAREQRLEPDAPALDVRQGRDLCEQVFERATIGCGGESQQRRALRDADGAGREGKEVDCARRSVARLRRGPRAAGFDLGIGRRIEALAIAAREEHRNGAQGETGTEERKRASHAHHRQLLRSI